MEQYTLVNRRDQHISALLYRPKQTVRGTMILEPGWRENKMSAVVQSIRDAALDVGVQVLVFDATHSMGSSDGDPETATYGLHYEDFEDAVVWAHRQDWFHTPMVVSGHSRGAYAAVRFAQSHPMQVGMLVAVAPSVSGQLSRKTFRKNDPDGFQQWKEMRPERPSRLDSGLRALWSKIRRRVNHDLRPQAHLITMPTLLIGGQQDERSPEGHLRKLFEAMAARDKTIKIIDGATHDFETAYEQGQLESTINQWLRNHLGS